MADDFNFQKDLENTILKSEMDKRDLLRQVFKMYVAKLFELKLKNARLELKALVEIKRNLISEFRLASLGEFQISTEQYEELFDETVKEICNDAALAHRGLDIMQMDNRFVIANGRTPSGIIVPAAMN